LRVDERPPLHEVFRRVAADDLLREGHDGGTVRGGGAGLGDRAIDVRSARAHGGVDVGERDADEPHS
jgi:hypothetical protein